MNLAIQAARHPIHAGVYLDDVTITGTCLKQTWMDTVEGL
jgi:hypothetical protein